MSPPFGAGAALGPAIQAFLESTPWRGAQCEPLTGDASTRRYYRLHHDAHSAILMDASRCVESVAPFLQLDRHLARLGFSVPAILAANADQTCLILEDFGDDTFTRLLEGGYDEERLYLLATDVLIALHRHAQAIPAHLRAYHPQKMLEDIELFLEWRTPGLSARGQAEFRRVWQEVLPLAHQVPATLLLRDYHVANLMLLPERPGIRAAGLLDFQDAYQGPITYDLMSLLQDARREVPPALRQAMIERYLAHVPGLDRQAFETSLAILAAQRHLRVLAIFERLSRRDGKHDYKQRHSPRVEAMLQTALEHPRLAGVKQWLHEYAR